jgi:hypothetical protein
MPATLETLQAEVMRLSPADRASLLDRLIVSPAADDGAEAAWDALADAREQALLEGTAEARPLGAALVRLQARFSG